MVIVAAPISQVMKPRLKDSRRCLLPTHTQLLGWGAETQTQGTGLLPTALPWEPREGRARSLFSLLSPGV